ncbi:putative Late nodulin [Medicago truncatula]|uniref:Nodule Cysteine-Rich (NCR) secreted peptide n=1 Tax=Medicago truncatula TaxID=3880 RepID=G7KU13_MEDTR|nr:Nodule Cysteine-Rich (NCR) secreted peptide [Medicago truncatula]AFK46823.1 unknown [Medicago truncatula]RHN45519.1 putative Late nodulin [Medicago truncatula]
MVKILKFIYVMIIFLSLFLVATNVNAINKCSQDSHCPKDMCKKPSKPRCVVSPKLPLSSKSGVCTCV